MGKKKLTKIWNHIDICKQLDYKRDDAQIIKKDDLYWVYTFLKVGQKQSEHLQKKA